MDTVLWLCPSQILILMWYVAGPTFRYRCDGRGCARANQMVAIRCLKSSRVGAFTWSSLRWFQSVAVRTKKEFLCCSVFEWGTRNGKLTRHQNRSRRCCPSSCRSQSGVSEGVYIALGIVSLFLHFLGSRSPPVPLRRQLGVVVVKCCLMSSDVGWHIRDKLWPVLKHGSINLYVHGNQKAR